MGREKQHSLGFRGQMLEPDSCAQRGKGWEPVAENSAGHGLLIKSVTLGKLALCAFILSSVKGEQED